MNLTPAQYDAVHHRGSSLLVSASAGAGKTEVLARRVVGLIADAESPCGIDRLLVVTFTRAAAAELRVRIARMLREAAAREGRQQLRDHLRRQELLVDTADIGTIDSWCGSIVREHFTDAGVDPDFTTLGAQEAVLLRRRTLDALMRDIHIGGSQLATDAQAWIAAAPSPGDGFLRDLIDRLNNWREHLVNPDAWFSRMHESVGQDDAREVLAPALRAECAFQHGQLSELLTGAGISARGPLQPYCDALADWAARLQQPDTLGAVVEEVAAQRIQTPRGADVPPLVVEVRDRWLKHRLQNQWDAADIAAILANVGRANTLMAILLRLEEAYAGKLAQEKAQRAAYTFADVQRMALDLLGETGDGAHRTPTRIAHRLRRRYEHILVDEYQDTSPVQVALLELASRTSNDQTNRFMVGDIKQSIYGFREAEPRLFADQADRFDCGDEPGRVIHLSDNFRSHADLLAPLNDLFSRLFHRQLGGTDYGPKEHLHAGRQQSEIPNHTLDVAPRIHIDILEKERRHGHQPNDGEVEPERIEHEAQLAANRIREMLERGVQIPERTNDGQVELRPLRFSDIVVLLRSAKNQAGLVARVFRDNGIACATSGREALLDSVEVRDIVSVLQLLVNRRQDVPLAAYFRSPMAGLTPAELLEIRRCAPAEMDFCDAVDHYRQMRPSESLATRLDGAMRQLDRWRAVSREEELPTLIWRIYHDCALVHFVRALPGGEQRVLLLRSLQNLAKAFAEHGGRSVSEFVAHLEQLADERIDPGALAIGGENLVRIMTIHGAKGLEFPIVFVLAAGNEFNAIRQRQPLQCDEALGAGLRFRDYPARVAVTGARHHVVRQLAAHRDLEEDLRLLYVAATRAREYLAVIGHTLPGAMEDCRAQFGDVDPLPLVSRQSVRSPIEWIMMAVAAGAADGKCDAGPRVAVATHDTPPELPDVPRGAGVPGSSPPAESESATSAWVERGVSLLSAEIDTPYQFAPAVVSVSALKEHAHRHHEEDRTATVAVPTVNLRRAKFAAPDAEDGRSVGTAVHRFLELAELRRLKTSDGVKAERDRLVTSRQLSPEQGMVISIEDIVWLVQSEVGALLLSENASVLREVPFIYGLRIAGAPRPAILRGVIDCVVVGDDELTLIDYKTDFCPDAATLEGRIRTYTVQLQLYARAAAAVFDRSVGDCWLAFVRMRRCVGVPRTAEKLDQLLADGCW